MRVTPFETYGIEFNNSINNSIYLISNIYIKNCNKNLHFCVHF